MSPLTDLEVLQLVERAETGRKGDRGEQGVGIRTIRQDSPDSFTVVLSDGRTYEIKLTAGRDGETGPAGTPGPRGERGPAGERGLPGAPGRDGTNGMDGQPGTSLDSALVNATGHLLIGLTDGTVLDLGRVVGPAGATGDRGPSGLSGPAGRDGNSIRSGNRAPNDAEDGQDGDFWIDLSSPQLDFYGPKRSGAWGPRTTFLKQPPAQQNVPGRSFLAGGGGGGSGGAVVPPFDIQMPVSAEIEIGRIEGDAAYVEYKVAAAADGTQWSAGTFSTAATALADDAEFTVSAELLGIGGAVNVSWRVARSATFLVIYATAPIAAVMKGKLRSVTA